MSKFVLASFFPILFGMYMPMCAPAVRPTLPPAAAPLSELWDARDTATADLFVGPWGAERAPNPHATYHLIERKHSGSNPGLTVEDGQDRVWHVKQAPDNDQGAEGPAEVVVSRVLSSLGYHQPPVYFLPSFMLEDASGVHLEPGGRFRLSERSLQERGPWSWQQNPFVGRLPYQGLLVTLMLFNSSDLKNDNNTLYNVIEPSGAVRKWYVVRDLGTSLGETGRLAPKRSDVDLFARTPFVDGVNGGFVSFAYRGWHQELVKDRISRADVVWATDRLSRLTEAQWADAFRAGGYLDGVARKFINRIHEKINEGRRLG